MKKVVLVNKFYHPSGGDCVYTLNLERLLKKNGYEVAVFSMRQGNTLESAWSGYFPEEVDYSSSGKKSFLKSFLRPLGASDVKRNFERLLNDFNPDVVHLNNIHTQLSPVIAELAYKRKIKVVWTLHDYKLLCPRSDCLRYGTQICESCFSSKWNVVKYRCTKNNLAASFLAYLEAQKWNRKRLEKYTACFICPSAFMKEKMIRGGFSEGKLKVLSNFIDSERVSRNDFVKSDYYCYVGRISQEKGLTTLLEAASSLPFQLKILGKGPLFDVLKAQYSEENIEFLGHQDWNDLKEILGKAVFSVIPSEWYENNLLGVLESLCLGTPVLGANIGGIPELIKEHENGLLFQPQNEADLRAKICMLFEQGLTVSPQEIAAVSCEKYSARHYLEVLNRIYEE